MSKIVIHIGAHKTGTTTIQRFFAQNRPHLAACNVIYPDIGPNDGHHVLAAPWMEVLGVDPKTYTAGFAKSAWAQITKDYAKTDKTVFISAEAFSRMLPQAVNFRDLAKKVRRFDEVEIVYITRDQASLIQSIWLQVTKDRSPPPFQSFLEGALTNKSASGIALDHGQVLEALLGAFSPSQIRFADFDTIRATSGGVTRYFLDILNVPAHEHGFLDDQNSTANISPPPLAAWITGQIFPNRKLNLDLVHLIDQSIEAELAKGRKSSLFSPMELQRIKQTFSQPNQHLADRLAPTCPGFGVGPIMFSQPRLMRNEINAAFWMRTLAILHAQ